MAAMSGSHYVLTVVVGHVTWIGSLVALKWHVSLSGLSVLGMMSAWLCWSSWYLGRQYQSHVADVGHMRRWVRMLDECVRARVCVCVHA